MILLRFHDTEVGSRSRKWYTVVSPAALKRRWFLTKACFGFFRQAAERKHTEVAQDKTTALVHPLEAHDSWTCSGSIYTVVLT